MPPRETIQRTAIREAFCKADRPLSPREVHDIASKRVPRLGIATIYRVLRELIEEEYLTAVELPGEPPRYERAGKKHHHHFRCRRCGGVFEVHGCPGDLRSLTPRGFRLEGHELLLVGLCGKCNG
jgi:Fur family transcriptional regulator, ferric uptake regulator